MGWLTIPATTGEEAEVTHELSMPRLFAHADTVLERGALEPGERFKMTGIMEHRGGAGVI